MWAILRTFGHAWAAPIAAVIPSADWMLVMRNTYLGLGSATSNRKSVQPSVNIVSTPSSSETGPSAGLLPLEMTPVNISIFSDSFIRRNGLDFAFAQETALGIDLFGGEDVTLQRRLTEHCGRAGQKSHVPGLER